METGIFANGAHDCLAQVYWGVEPRSKKRGRNGTSATGHRGAAETNGGVSDGEEHLRVTVARWRARAVNLFDVKVSGVHALPGVSAFVVRDVSARTCA